MKVVLKAFLVFVLVSFFTSEKIHSQSNRLRYLSYTFPADSLNGFNEIAASNKALQKGYFGTEYKVFMYRAKRHYINKKYHYSPAPNMDQVAKGVTPVINAAPCVNEDFEASPSSTSTTPGVGSVGTTLAGWTVSQGQNNSSCTMGGCCPTAGGNDVWVRQTPWATGTTIGTIPNSPFGGTKVLQMNDQNVNVGEVVRIQQTFPVAATNALFRLAYMAQMDGTGHSCCDQPFMKITMLNCTNAPLACPSLSVNAPGPSCASTMPSGWSTNTSGYSYTTAWQLYSLDLTPYIGSCVTIQITVGDCTGWGHHGMAFIDAMCDPMVVNVNNVPFPAGASIVAAGACAATATVVAPPGLGPYTWNGPAGSGVTNNPNQSFTTSVGGAYTLSMNPPGSCAPITRTVNLTFAPPPIAGFTTANVCTSYTITNTGSAAPAVQSYSFTGPGAPASYTTTSPTSTVSFPGAGTYTVYQTIANTASCVVTQSLVINVPNGPNPAFTTPSYTQCLTGNAFTFNATTAAGTHTYNFSPAAGAPATGNTNNYGPVNFTAPGTYTVTHTITNAGCTAQTTSVVVLNPDPTPTANNTGPVCVGGSVTINGTGGGTYNWSGPSGFTSAAQNNTLTGLGVANGGVYTVTVTLNGCTATTTTNLIIATATAAANNTGPYCAGQTIQLNGTAGATYTWTGPGFNSNLQNPTIAGATTAMAGTYNFTVDFGGCQANGSTNVTVNALPTPTAANNGPLCEGATLMLAGSPAVTYTWTGPNSFGSPLQSPNINNVTLAANGTYTFAVTDANNCSNSITTNVVINSNPTPVVNNPSLCENQTISLTANGGSTYNWSGPGGFTSNLQNPTIPNATTAMSGVYTVTVTTAGGCVNTANANVAVTPAPTPSIVTNSPICINNILMLSATGGVSYQWTGPNGFFSSVQNPTVNANTTNYSGTYQVTVTDGNGCSASTTATAQINPNPVPSITSGPNTGCAPLCVQFNVTSTPTVANANWNLGDGTSGVGLTAATCYTTTGVYTISAVVSDAAGCTGSTTYTAQVYPNPVADFNHAPIKPIINVDGDVVFTDASHSANIVSWQWYFMNTAQYTSTLQNPTFLYTEPGTYAVALVVKSDKGCVDTIVRPIVVGEDFGIYVPDAFTPNADGLNDVFQPKGFGIVKYELQIFDRWGEKIFGSKSFEEGWDGKYQGRGGKIIADGVYTWLINITDVFGKAHELKGHVTLIK